jgi:hypothetical protein
MSKHVFIKIHDALPLPQTCHISRPSHPSLFHDFIGTLINTLEVKHLRLLRSVDIFIQLTFMHNTEISKVTCFGLRTGHPQTHALLKTHEKTVVIHKHGKGISSP